MPPDLRLPALACAAWAGALWVLVVPVPGWLGPALVGTVVAGVTVAALRGRHAGRGRALRMVGAVAAVLLVAGGVATVRVSSAERDPVAHLAQRWTTVTLLGTVQSDPWVIQGAFSRSVVVTVGVREVRTDVLRARVRATVRVWADDSWATVGWGETVRFTARLQPDPDPGISAIARVETDSGPERVRAPSLWWQAAGAIRAAIRDSVSGRPDEQAALLPALVVGDTAGIDSGLADDFRTTGLTHLLAVSGTNLTLVVGALLWLARWCGVRGRWLVLVGAAGIGGFILLARTEPSVVRAAAMGAVGLIALSSNGRHRGVRALALAVLGLVLVDPLMAISLGFALSVLATAGILFVAPLWRDALAVWMPRWIAEAIAVPTAAQLACTPLVAAISGQVSLVAVVANLLAEPAVGPATVLGLAGGLIGVVWPAAGAGCGWLASWCVGWIIAVAHRCADVPGAETGWGTGPVALVGLSVLSLALALWAPYVVRRRWVGVVLAVVLVAVIAVRVPGGPWPPPGWLLVMCDVGQGDAMVLSVEPGAGVVIDTGPEPAPLRECLDDLGIERVPLAVLTHFDADHVGGIEALFDGRRVGQLWTTVLDQPEYGHRLVQGASAAAGVRPTAVTAGTTVAIGAVTLQVLWPPATLSAATDPNGSSVVLLVSSGGVRFLLAGDLDPAGSARLAALVPGLHVDVLKVPHHGSRFQDEDWLVSLGAGVALTSVGADNTYGHPAAATLDPLRRAGVRVLRTDRDGALAVLASTDGVAVRRHG